MFDMAPLMPALVGLKKQSSLQLFAEISDKEAFYSGYWFTGTLGFIAF